MHANEKQRRGSVEDYAYTDNDICGSLNESPYAKFLITKFFLAILIIMRMMCEGLLKFIVRI